MDFKIRQVDLDQDYNKLCEWAKYFRFTYPPKDFLSETGIVISLNNVDVAAGFVYKTNSKAAWVEFIVSNPKVKENRTFAIQYLINVLSDYAYKMGAKYVYTSLKNDSLINHFKSSGFVKGSINCTEMIKIL